MNLTVALPRQTVPQHRNDVEFVKERRKTVILESFYTLEIGNINIVKFINFP